MPKFHLNIQELVQGKFILKRVNMNFVFQVNCPGCSQLTVLAEICTFNQLQGTPSYIIFDDKYDIQRIYFCHQNGGVLKTRLEDLLG
jgi:Uma2 family endonuclease